MPTYEYVCSKCGYSFEKFQSIKDAPLKICPKCSGEIKRLLGTGAGIIFKGSGFYATDYRSPGYSADSKKEKEPDKKKGSAGEKETKKESTTTDSKDKES